MMVISTIGGGLFCLFVSALSLEQIRRGTVSFEIPNERSYYEKTVSFDGPGKPWLSLSSIILLAASLTYIPRIYQVFRRKKYVISSTKRTTQLMTVGGLCFFAGAEMEMGIFLLGLVLTAYAGIGYLAYTRWERVRAQLYKD